jgi:hypothetical protein
VALCDSFVFLEYIVSISAKEDINKDATMIINILIKITIKFIFNVTSEKDLNISFDIPIDTNPIDKPNTEEIIPTITDDRYLPIISSFALIGNVNIVSNVPFSLSDAVILFDILLVAAEIENITYIIIILSIS